MSKFKTRQNLNDQNFSQQTGDTLTLSGNVLYGANPSRIFTKNTLASVDYITGITSSASISGATNGLNVSNRKTRLGGSLVTDTTIDLSGRTLSFIDNVNSVGISLDPQVAGGSILLAHAYVGDLEFKSTGLIFSDIRGTKRGIQYEADYSGGFNSRSLVDAGFVTGITSQIIIPTGATYAGNGLNRRGTIIRLGGALTGDTFINLGGNNLILSATTGTLRYAGDYSLNYTSRSLVDKAYVDNKVISGVTASNGLTEVGGQIRLGGTVTGDTTIGLSSNNLTITASTGTLKYGGNYSSNYTARSIVDAGYVTGITSILGTGSITGATNGLSVSSNGKKIKLGGTLTGSTTINGGGYAWNIGTSGSRVDGSNLYSGGGGGGNIYFEHSYNNLVSNLIVGNSGDPIQLSSEHTDGSYIGIYSDGAPNLTSSKLFIEAYTITAAKYAGMILQPNTNDILTYATGGGIKYGGNYSGSFTSRSLVDKGYVTGLTSTLTPKAGNGLNVQGSVTRLGGSTTGDTTITLGAGKDFSINGNGGFIEISNTSGNTEIWGNNSVLMTAAGSSGSLGLESRTVNGMYQVVKQSITDPYVGSIGHANRIVFTLNKDQALFTDTRVGVVNLVASGYVNVKDVKVISLQSLGVMAPQIRTAVDAATTEEIDLIGGGELEIDGYQTTTGDRVLVKDQSAMYENGVYIVDTGSWTRATDFDDAELDKIAHGLYFPVTNGDTYAGTGWRIDQSFTQFEAIELDVTDIPFSQYNGTFFGSGLMTIDGYALQEGDRVFISTELSGEYDPMAGIWVASSGAWTRATDYDTEAEINSTNMIKATHGLVEYYTGLFNSYGIFNIGGSIDQGTFIIDYTLLTTQRIFLYSAVGSLRKGIEYAADYSPQYTSRSLVDKGFVTGITSTLISSSNAVTGATNGLTKKGKNITLGGTLTGATSINGNVQNLTLGTDVTTGAISNFTLNTSTSLNLWLGTTNFKLDPAYVYSNKLMYVQYQHTNTWRIGTYIESTNFSGATGGAYGTYSWLKSGGYVGTSLTAGVFGWNNSVGTGNGTFSGTAWGNAGIWGFADGTGNGSNFGNYGNASNGLKNYGVHGRANVSKVGGYNVGIYGTAYNSSGNYISILGELTSTSGSDAQPAYSGNSVALFNNKTIAASILTLMDNSTEVFTIADGGELKLSRISGTAGQVPTSNGVGVPMVWSTPSSFASNGLNKQGAVTRLGGVLTGATTITGTSANTLTLIYPLGAAQVNGGGIWLKNNVNAANNSQRISPSLVFEGQGWRTNATAESQSVKFAIDVVPVQGLSSPSGLFRILSSINNAAYSTAMSINSTSSVVTVSTLDVSALNAVNTMVTNGASHGANATTISIVKPFGVSGITSGVSVGITPPITFTVGSMNYYGLNISPSYSFSGTHSNGRLYGVNYAPTLTSLTGIVEHLAWRNTSGSILIGGSTLSGATTRVDIRGIGATTGKALRIASSGNTERFVVQDNGKVFVNPVPTNDNALTQLLVRDNSTGEIKYKDATTLVDKSRREKYYFSSNLFTEQSTSYRGIITGMTVYLTDELQSVSYETRLDTVSSGTSQANLTNVQTWINSNITGNEATGTIYWIKVLATYKSGRTGEAEVRLSYTAT